jgi:hypothetical protein
MRESLASFTGVGGILSHDMLSIADGALEDAYSCQTLQLINNARLVKCYWTDFSDTDTKNEQSKYDMSWSKPAYTHMYHASN